MKKVQCAELDDWVIEAVLQDDSCYTSIARACGVSVQTITRITKRLGVYRSKEVRTTAAWDRRLSSLAPWFRAYLLGLVATDGSVKTGRVVVTISEKDGAHLVKVASRLGVGTAVHRSGTSKAGRPLYARSFNFGCRIICDRLRALGLQRDKTYTLDSRVVDAVPAHTFADFVRGCFDGDGNVSPVNYSARAAIDSASKPFLEALVNRLVERIGVTAPKLKKYSIWKAQWGSKRDLRLLYDYLYSDPSRLCLERKRDRIAGHLERIERFDKELVEIEAILRTDLGVEPSYYAIDRKHGWHLGRSRKYALRLGLDG